MKKINRFDQIVETLFEGFSKTPNFDLTQKDALASKLFNIISYRISELTSYKELVVKHYVPETNKAIHDSRREIENSKYRHLVDLKSIDLKDTLYETIRLSYVGLFHKLENYTNDVETMTELLFGEFLDSEKSLNVWTKENFNFHLKDWKQFNVVHKINWVANCVKHKDGYPAKDPKPKGYENAKENEKLRIEVNQFKEDCTLLISFYPIYLRLMFLFAQHKMISDELAEKNSIYDNSFYKSQSEYLKKSEYTLKQLITYLKNI